MRLLVLGGTRFVSSAVAHEAARRGHDVVCACRGASGPTPEGTALVPIDRSRPDGLAPLAGERFDAGVDLALTSASWVRAAQDGVDCAHWSYVSSIAVYADALTPAQRAADAPLREPRPDAPHVEAPDLQTYGAAKVACEQAIRDATDDAAFVVRPGLVAGPGDPSGSFGYWPVRMAAGGRVAIPAEDPAADVPLPAQLIDVRDLAAWIVDAAEQRLAGTFDAIGPSRPLRAVLEGIADAVGADDLQLVPVPQDVLRAAGVTPWDGPRSLPLWPEPLLEGSLRRDVTASLDAGLRVRSLRDTARATLRWTTRTGATVRARAGLDAADERDLLLQAAP